MDDSDLLDADDFVASGGYFLDDLLPESGGGGYGDEIDLEDDNEDDDNLEDDLFSLGWGSVSVSGSGSGSDSQGSGEDHDHGHYLDGSSPGTPSSLSTASEASSPSLSPLRENNAQHASNTDPNNRSLPSAPPQPQRPVLPPPRNLFASGLPLQAFHRPGSTAASSVRLHSISPFDGGVRHRDHAHHHHTHHSSISSLAERVREQETIHQNLLRDYRRVLGRPNGRSSDELVEMEFERRREARRRRPQSEVLPPPPAASARRSQQPPQQATFIDLTEEPDSPPMLPLSLPRLNSNDSGTQTLRNPRRSISQTGRTPSLARSDGSLLGSHPPVIDLTGDSPGDSRRPPTQNRNRAYRDISAARDALFYNSPSPDVTFMGLVRRLRDVQYLHDNLNNALPALIGRLRGGGAGAGNNGAAGGGSSRGPQSVDFDVQIIGQNNLPRFPATANPLAGNDMRFNYQANGFGGHPDLAGARAETPKPAYVAPPKAREGFTRNTGEDLAVVCPSCDEELKYDPDEVPDEAQPPPAKRQRKGRERARGEHHFWAIKACGHVYCKQCFENRRPTSKGAKTGFRPEPKPLKKLLCAVGDCASDVSRKDAWVGIFL